MSKRKLNKQQRSRIKQNQEKQVMHAENKDLFEENLSPKAFGVVITRYAKHAVIENGDKTRFFCLIRQNLGSLTAGDRVVFQHDTKSQNGVIVSRLERESVLGRGDKKGQIKPVAANVQQMLIVIAPKPVITPILLDSYLVAAEALNIKPIIIYNKTDIGIDTSFIEYYESIDYTVIQTSTINQLGFNTLIEKINDKISVFVGQSGVGKSTLISTILPNEEIKNQSISTHSELGKHTTSNSTLYHLPSGGSIIDSPGIREFGLWHMDKNKIVHGFKEFRPLIGQCKYKNCTHTHEPECALINTVNKGLLSKERLKSLQYLIQKF